MRAECFRSFLFVRQNVCTIQLEVSIISEKGHQLNEQIRDIEIRVIGEDGGQLGIMKTIDAKNMAAEKNLDLVKIAPKSVPPVCKIMDYGKFRFEQKKKEKEARKNQKIIEIKEVQLSINIDTHDFNTKLNHAIKFLQGGAKVKVSIRFRGREMAHTNLGAAVIKRFCEACAEYSQVEKPSKMEGRTMILFLAPRKDLNREKQERPKEERPAGDNPVVKKLMEEQSAKSELAEDKLAMDKPVEEKPALKESMEDKPAEKEPAAKKQKPEKSKEEGEQKDA